jgi:hypothetical protein
MRLSDNIWIKMAASLEKLLKNYYHSYLTDAEFAVIIPGSPDSRYSKIKRLVAQGEIVRIRRGLYWLPDKSGLLMPPHPFELAQYIYGPSYISLESALSYHRLIPEAVYTVTSATVKRRKEFETPLGMFGYLHLPLEGFYTEVELIEENGYKFFMAKPWKAICDYIFCYKKNFRKSESVFEFLRIDSESLPILSREEVYLLDNYYRQKRITRFLKSVKISKGS